MYQVLRTPTQGERRTAPRPGGRQQVPSALRVMCGAKSVNCMLSCRSEPAAGRRTVWHGLVAPPPPACVARGGVISLTRAVARARNPPVTHPTPAQGMQAAPFANAGVSAGTWVHAFNHRVGLAAQHAQAHALKGDAAPLSIPHLLLKLTRVPAVRATSRRRRQPPGARRRCCHRLFGLHAAPRPGHQAPQGGGQRPAAQQARRQHRRAAQVSHAGACTCTFTRGGAGRGQGGGIGGGGCSRLRRLRLVGIGPALYPSCTSACLYCTAAVFGAASPAKRQGAGAPRHCQAHCYTPVSWPCRCCRWARLYQPGNNHQPPTADAGRRCGSWRSWGSCWSPPRPRGAGGRAARHGRAGRLRPIRHNPAATTTGACACPV